MIIVANKFSYMSKVWRGWLCWRPYTAGDLLLICDLVQNLQNCLTTPRQKPRRVFFLLRPNFRPQGKLPSAPNFPLSTTMWTTWCPWKEWVSVCWSLGALAGQNAPAPLILPEIEENLFYRNPILYFFLWSLWVYIVYTAKTKYRNFVTNIPRKVISGSQSQFPHSCVCERFIYSHDWSAFSAGGNM